MANENGLTKAEKKAAIDYAWARYRAASRAIPRNLPYAGHKHNGVFREGFLEKDDALFRAYLATERAILSERERSEAA